MNPEEKHNRDESLLNTVSREKEKFNKSFELEESILEPKNKDKSEEVNDLSDFYGHLGRNGGMVYLVDSYFVKDMDEDLKRKERRELIAVESLKGYTKEDILVLKIDASSKKGYVIINDKIDIPLINLKGRNCNYFFNRDEALKEWKRLSEIEENLCIDIIRVAESAKSYIRRTIDKNQH